MSTKLALFAFPSTVPDETILRELGVGVDTVSLDVSMGPAFIALRETGSLKVAFVLAQGRRPGSGVMRATITEGFFAADYPMAFLGYDDQNGVYLFDGWGSESLFLLSDGDRLGGAVEKITIDRAPEGPSNAIDVGLRQVFGYTDGRAFLEVAYATNAYHVGTAELVDLPSDALPLVAYWPEDSDFTRAKLPVRRY